METLSALLIFWTGYLSLPSDTATKLTVDYLTDDANKSLAEASTCCMTLSLPIIHDTYEEFKRSMDISLQICVKSG